MAKLAIYVDGGYVGKLAEHHFNGQWVDYEKLSHKVLQVIGASTQEPLDLFRTYYYDCLPYQSDPPTEDEARRFGQKRKFFAALGRLPRYAVRQGRLMYRGQSATGHPIFQQKRVDLMIGLDVALLAAKHQIAHAAVISGDSDLLPAVAVAQQEGVSVWLVHGPPSTYANELWSAVDERILIDDRFVGDVARSRRPLSRK